MDLVYIVCAGSSAVAVVSCVMSHVNVASICAVDVSRRKTLSKVKEKHLCKLSLYVGSVILE